MENDNEIEISFIPKENQTPAARPIGVYPSSSHCGGSENAICENIKKKIKRYKELNYPLIVFANILSWWGQGDIIDQLIALYGTAPQEFVIGEDITRIKDSVWFSKNGNFKENNLIATILGTITEDHIIESDMKLFYKPHLEIELGQFKLPKVIPGQKEIADKDLSLKRLFELDDGWPGPYKIHKQI